MPLTLYDAKEDKPLKSVKNVIGIAAGKGGVGKSTITVHLADALKKAGYRVGVLDADIYGPSLRHMLPEDELPFEEKNVLHPAKSRGISVISMAYFRDKDEPASVRGPIASNLVKQFINNINWGELDYLLIDFPPGTGDIQLSLCQTAVFKGVIMVTTPQEIALLDVRKAMGLFQQFKTPILGIVENMSFFIHPTTHEKLSIFGTGGGQRLSLEAKVPLLASLPIDPSLNESSELGLIHAPAAPTLTTLALVKLVEKLTKICL